MGQYGGFAEKVVAPLSFPIVFTVSSSSLTASWNAVDNATSYEVFLGVEPDQMIPVARSTFALTFTQDNLQPGTYYFVQVVANLGPGKKISSALYQELLQRAA